MRILLLHQNFPGQFLHLAPELVRRGHEVLALTDQHNQRPSPVRTLRYRHTAEKPDARACRLGRTYTEMTDRGLSVARAARQLRDRQSYVPDLIFGHPGWGETLFLREVWPDARLIIYGEFYYRTRGADVGFDPEFSRDPVDQGVITQARNAHLALAALQADAIVSPTRWQASTFPAALQPRIKVIFDGVDTDRVAPDPTARLDLPGGLTIRAGDEVLSFVNRNLEPYRGYHIFMRALPAVLAARPKAQVVIVGGDDTSYGAPPPGGGSWKDHLLAEVGNRLDHSRVHFLGNIPYPDFVTLMQITRVHAYLTYPFVLSWSLFEAMAAGAHVVASNTAPLAELIRDGENGQLVDFFDIAGWGSALITALADPDRFAPLRGAARETIVTGYDLHTVCLTRMATFVEAVSARAQPGAITNISDGTSGSSASGRTR